MPRRPAEFIRLAVPSALLWALLAGTPALAEREDRYKATNVEADRMDYDDLKQVNVFTGSVVLTKGTITLRADRLILRQDPEGYQHATADGEPASFRQKRDGLDEWVEGYGEHVRYDGRTETLHLTGKARVRRLDGTRVIDEIEGAVIVYDSRTERFSVDGAAGPAVPNGRVKVVIQPRLDDAASPGTGTGTGTGTTLRPAPPAGATRPPAR
jgi:lipopolysaccharide export system protein LptA